LPFTIQVWSLYNIRNTLFLIVGSITLIAHVRLYFMFMLSDSLMLDLFEGLTYFSWKLDLVFESIWFNNTHIIYQKMILISLNSLILFLNTMKFSFSFCSAFEYLEIIIISYDKNLYSIPAIDCMLSEIETSTGATQIYLKIKLYFLPYSLV
jgi:hypothetical protein